MQHFLLWLLIIFQIILLIALLRILIKLLPLPFYIHQQLPYIPTDKRTIKYIIKSNILKDAQTIIDLGCGTGTLIKGLRKTYPDKNYIGVEYQARLAKIAQWRFQWRKPAPTIVIGDMFTYPIDTADAVVGFWVKSLMPQLLKKLVQECKSGCIIISNTFPLPTHPELIELLPEYHKHKIFIYQKRIDG